MLVGFNNFTIGSCYVQKFCVFLRLKVSSPSQACEGCREPHLLLFLLHCLHCETNRDAGAAWLLALCKQQLKDKALLIKLLHREQLLNSQAAIK